MRRALWRLRPANAAVGAVGGVAPVAAPICNGLSRGLLSASARLMTQQSRRPVHTTIARASSASTAAPTTNGSSFSPSSSSATAAVSAATHSAAVTSATGVLSASDEALVSELVRGVLASDRLALSRAITLVESSHPSHLVQAGALMARLAEHRAAGQEQRDAQARHVEQLLEALPTEAKAEAALTKPRVLRIGISGPPGVGKSTFIECFGQYLLSLGHRLAVLSIDPSSHVSGGSILGDKTRMLELSRSPDAYVRPSPSRCVLGGVGAHTYDAVLLCEAAGYDLVFVETVGVGQSEVSVADLCDMLLLLVQPGGGDELQGMKKGIVELIDLVIVNKADGALLTNARHTKLEFMHALQLNTRRKKETDWRPLVKLCSSVSESSVAQQSDYSRSDDGEAGGPGASSSGSARPATTTQQDQITDIWRAIGAFEDWARGPLGDFSLRRARQSKALISQALQDALVQRMSRALAHLPEYQRLSELWTRAEGTPSRGPKPTAPSQDALEASTTAASLVPRVEAQRIIADWLEREYATIVTTKAEQQQAQQPKQ